MLQSGDWEVHRCLGLMLQKAEGRLFSMVNLLLPGTPVQNSRMLG